jgi:DNA-binding protein H-NS
MEDNILRRAEEIVYNRSEERTRQYGDFQQSMERATNIFNLISKQEIKIEDMYLAMVAMKLARQQHSHKEDNLLDAVAYMAKLNDYLNQSTKINQNFKNIL